MVSKSSIILIVFVTTSSIAVAQNLNDNILITIGGHKAESGEFIRMYKKSSGETSSSLSIDKYLDQFIIFKLKVADAINEGLDTLGYFKTELQSYRNQLAQNYLVDNQKKEELIRQAYTRSLTDINAWHILIATPQAAAPQDTLIAWRKAMAVRERIISGETFEQVARSVSDDQSVKINGGNLGYFSALQMVVPFEDAVYSLRRNRISNPVRTPYGYHIIMVANSRPSKGMVHVAHIMKTILPGSDDKAINQVNKDIYEIYNKLQAGESFSELAKNYSDHKESASNGGKLEWFRVGEITSEFAEAAFALTDTGTYSKPVKTPYGWHIIKLLDKKAPGTFEESRSFIESNINQAYLNTMSRNALAAKLKREYKFRTNATSLQWFLANTDSAIMTGQRRYERAAIPRGSIYSFANQSFSNSEFATLIGRNTSMTPTNDSARFIRNLIDRRSSEHVLAYENSNLERKYPEFRYLMNEFHDGILLFEISGIRIWNKANSDSTEIRKFYEEHKYERLSKREMDGRIYSLKSGGDSKSLMAAYKKLSRRPNFEQKLSDKFNRKNNDNLSVTDSLWFQGDDAELDGIKWKSGVYELKWKGYPSVIVINNIIEPAPLPFEQVQNEILNDYQEQLEKEWIEQLKEKYSVQIDNAEYKNITKILSNE